MSGRVVGGLLARTVTGAAEVAARAKHAPLQTEGPVRSRVRERREAGRDGAQAKWVARIACGEAAESVTVAGVSGPPARN